MDDRELENKLKQGKTESDSFFYGWKFEPLRKKVHARIAEKTPVHISVRRHFSWKTAWKVGLGLACIMVAVWLPFNLDILHNAGQKGLADSGRPVVHQAVTMDNSNSIHLVDFFPLRKPDYKENSLMAVIWKVGASGDYQMMYSSLFENTSEPSPVSTIDLNGNNLLLISSGNSQKNYIHYRLVGYSNGSIKTYWEQDFVREGKLGVREGMLVEQRAVYGTGSDQSDGKAFNKTGITVSYIIPYQVSDSGELLLPVDHVRLKRGEQLLLVSEGKEHKVEAVSKESAVKKIDVDDSPVIQQDSAAYFYAFNPGNDCILIVPTGVEKKAPKTLLIEVGDEE